MLIWPMPKMVSTIRKKPKAEFAKAKSAYKQRRDFPNSPDMPVDPDQLLKVQRVQSLQTID